MGGDGGMGGWGGWGGTRSLRPCDSGLHPGVRDRRAHSLPQLWFRPGARTIRPSACGVHHGAGILRSCVQDCQALPPRSKRKKRNKKGERGNRKRNNMKEKEGEGKMRVYTKGLE